MLKNFDLKQKKVIDIDTAELVGYIRDMDIDVETGRINSVTVPSGGVLKAFGIGRSITVPWDSVMAVGKEYILVKSSQEIK